MQRYQFKRSYSLIILRWCLGYLSKKEAVSFLRCSKMWLKDAGTRSGSSSAPRSVIIVLDNVCKRAKYYITADGQTVRRQDQMAAIFTEARLGVLKKTRLHKLVEGYEDTIAWALC